ncbi:hypothetical protein Gasu2_55440 [Galdieria sulphuraria]|uniref:Uncharacterized protein n=1 Tax=Galdieria sulphuraria TaxID=130081 RepID=M2XGM5_GALSU|nr:hypothetical protein Gasu_34180 isoform 1 [Galdieria sulphuraria]EME29217.1 hypothetical protein isoform 1 [Galdieria sulphuraria]GJD11403.1 hypothetical protein Gasu2_55440 [Galdieria sulphuraria]|eukprot:XP_005705737.1 hypothetical protein isoform 1 [Galdieria sulphuraria]
MVSSPKLVWKCNPSTKLKLRKHFYPLALTKLTLGADLDLQHGFWTFHTAWKDRIIGGRLAVKDNQVSLVKEFLVDQKNTFNIHISYDWKIGQTLFGFRFSPYRGIQTNTHPPGMALRRKIPLDYRTKLDVFAWLQFPEATCEATSTGAVSFGTGDFILDIQQLNLYLELKGFGTIG